jgi:hypothetical protein
MSKLRFKISMSLDGFVAGPSQSVKNPLGIGGGRLHEWAFQLAVFRGLLGLEGGEVNESTPVVEESIANIGATVMGRNMFGGHPGPWDARNPWNGWWGVNPPFHHPVMGINLVATLLGSGERLFDGVGDNLHGLNLVRTVAAPKLTQLKFAKR